MAIDNVLADDQGSAIGSTFVFEVGDLVDNGDSVAISYHFNRTSGSEGGYAGDVVMFAGGGETNRRTVGGSFVGPLTQFQGEFTASVDPTDDLTISLPDTNLISDLTVPRGIEPDVTARCEFDGVRVAVGETVTVPVVLTAGDGTLDTTTTVTITMADQTASETVTLSPNESSTIEAEFTTPEVGSYTPVVSVE